MPAGHLSRTTATFCGPPRVTIRDRFHCIRIVFVVAAAVSADVEAPPPPATKAKSGGGVGLFGDDDDGDDDDLFFTPTRTLPTKQALLAKPSSPPKTMTQDQKDALR